MSLDINDNQSGAYSAAGQWVWDGHQWMPAQGAAPHPVIAPPTSTGRSTGSVVRGMALGLGILAIVVGVALWVLAGNVRATPTNDMIVTGLLLLGFVPGQLAVIFGLPQRSRTRVSTAAFTCGLVGLALNFLWVAFTILNF